MYLRTITYRDLSASQRRLSHTGSPKGHVLFGRGW
jgi:hypothetical protein